MTVKTLTVGLTADQVAERRTYVGGSDAAAILGVDPYRTPLDIYQIKVGEREPDPPNAAMKRGIFLEPIARKLYRELTGRKVRRFGLVRHADRPFMGCLVDGVIVAAKKNGHEGPGVLEIKAPGIWTFSKIEREGLPLHWVLQLQHNMEVTGYSWGSFALFSGELWRLIHFDVERDLELAHALVIKEEQFWLQSLQPRIPPPAQPDTTPEIAGQLARAQGAQGAIGGKLIVRSDAEWAEAARVYLEANEIVETGEHLKATAVERLKQVMGSKGAVEGSGLRCYWSERDGRVTLDKKKLATEHPEIDLTKYEKRGAAYEDFRAYQVRAVVGD